MLLSSMMSEGRVLPARFPTPVRVYETFDPGESTLHTIQEHVDWGDGRDDRDEIIHHSWSTKSP